MPREHCDGQEWLSRKELQTWLDDQRVRPRPKDVDCDLLIDQLRRIWNHTQSAAMLRRADPLVPPAITELKDVSLAAVIDPLLDAMAARFLTAHQAMQEGLRIVETIQAHGGALWPGGGMVLDLTEKIELIISAIAVLGAPRPAEVSGPGRPTTEWHSVARPFADAIQSTLLAAGFRPRAQRHRKDAVAYIAARALSGITGAEITDSAFEEALRRRVRRKRTDRPIPLIAELGGLKK